MDGKAEIESITESLTTDFVYILFYSWKQYLANCYFIHNCVEYFIQLVKYCIYFFTYFVVYILHLTVVAQMFLFKWSCLPCFLVSVLLALIFVLP